jgi:hypothetical protein
MFSCFAFRPIICRGENNEKQILGVKIVVSYLCCCNCVYALYVDVMFDLLFLCSVLFRFVALCYDGEIHYPTCLDRIQAGHEFACFLDFYV